MYRRRRFTLGAAALTAAALLISACASTGRPAQSAWSVPRGLSGAVIEPATRVGPLAGSSIAAIFPGPVDDSDFNELALTALQSAAADGASARYVESVPVPDAEQLLRELAAAGPTVIWVHGSQFYEAAVKVAKDNPAVTFIGEAYGRPEGQPRNMWVLDLQFYLGFYVLGVLAGALTTSGVIGYVGGLPLPFSYSEVHALRQAIADRKDAAEVRAVWTGDFNNPAKAEDLATTVIADGADVIIGSLNDGTVGTFRAAAAARASGRAVWVTAKYTDKSGLDTAGAYAGSVQYDFAGPLGEVLRQISGGTTTGYYPFTFATGITVALSPDLPAPARSAAESAVRGISQGAISVGFDPSAVDE